MLILRAEIALNAVICMTVLIYIFLDNGVMTTPKRRILSFFLQFYFQSCEGISWQSHVQRAKGIS